MSTKKTENMTFILTPDQAEMICKYFGEDINELDDWEICELLDELIDNLPVD